jgi:hypothetical protein
MELGNGARHGDWAVKGDASEGLVRSVPWAVGLLETRSDLDSRPIVDLDVCKSQF